MTKKKTGCDKKEKALQTELLKIVKKNHDYIPTLETRHSDGLDFHEVSVWTLKKMLMEAYKLGKSEALKEIKTAPPEQKN